MRLPRWYPRLRIAGTHHGFFDIGSAHDDRVVEDINERRPDIVLVGMGTPKQELWVEHNAGRLDTDVAVDRRGAVRLCVGPGAPGAAGVVGGQWPGMDLPTRDRAPAHVAPVPARQPGLHQPGDERRHAPARHAVAAAPAPR